MKNPARLLAWRGPPLALQITGLLLGALVVAQLVTLLLTIFFPPDPPAKYGLADIAAAIRTQPESGLRRDIRATAPVVTGRGWLSSDTSRADLARLLGVAPERVALAFYTPLPFAGTVGTEALHKQVARARTSDPDVSAISVTFEQPVSDEPEKAMLQPAVLLVPGGQVHPGSLLRLAQAGPGPGGPGGPPMGSPGGGFPGGGFPGGGFPGGFPGGATPPSAPSGPPPALPPGAPPSTNSPAAGAPPAQPSSVAPPAGAAQPPSAPPAAALPPQTLTMPAPAAPPAGVSIGSIDPAPRTGAKQEPRRTDKTQIATPPASPALPDFRPSSGDRATGDVAAVSPSLPAATTIPDARRLGLSDGQPIRRTGLQGAIDKARSLFGLSPAPYVEGDFVAAVELADGRWIVVQPRSGWLTAWQKRVALWFFIAFGIRAPIGWLFARRLSRPLDRFADAAAQLGRDPSVAIAALDGPAEIGRAAHAFNLMQKRLRSFVDDRTAMVGAISHDLRTPLTRMRFRVEDAPDDIRDGMLQEVDDMEEMITSVLAFIRDASTPGVRERLDLKTLLDDVAEDVAVIGADVPVEAVGTATVEIEVMGMRRVLANLVENALKYGEHARIELTVSKDEAIAAVIDDGPGLPDEELEQVFQPFYRTASARASGAPGTGLGLAVCRSIARAHGGDVCLCRSPKGFRAEVRIPLAYDQVRAQAA